MKKILLQGFLVLACAPLQAAQVPLLGAELASFSVLAGGYASYDPGTVIHGSVGAVTYVVRSPGSSSGGDETNTPRVNAAVAQIEVAQQALSRMGAGTRLAELLSGTVTLAAGIYDATSLTTAAGSNLVLDGGGADAPVWVFNIPTFLETGAQTHISLRNAGAHASVLWNVGGVAMIGDETVLNGILLATSHITEASGVNMVCGNLFSKSYISIAANGSSTSSACPASGSWSGALTGLASNMEIVDGKAMPMAPVPEPQTAALMLAGCVALGLGSRRSGRRQLHRRLVCAKPLASRLPVVHTNCGQLC